MSNYYIPRNPHYAFIRFKIGDFDLSVLPPEHIQSFTYERITDSSTGSSNSLSITVVDESAILMENAISEAIKSADGFPVCEFSYGYEGEENSSPVYTGLISEFDIDFQASSAILNLNGKSTGLKNIADPKTKVYQAPIHTIVRQIAEEEGWLEGSIVACKRIFEAGSTEEDKKFYRLNMSGASFIARVLAPYAVSEKNGQSAYKLIFKDTFDGTVVSFAPEEFGKVGDYLFSYEMQLGTGKNSSIKSFNPQYKGMAAAIMGGGIIEANTVNRVTNEMISLVHSEDTDPNRIVTGDKDIDRSKYTRRIGSSSYTEEEVQRIAANMWYSNTSHSYGAEMVVIGNPMIEVSTNIEVLILNKDGVPHHSSGSYLITKVTDSISGGTFETSMELFRNSISIGANSSKGININITPGTGIPVSTLGVMGAYQNNPPVNLATANGGDIVSVAVSQIGTVEGAGGYSKYGQWYGENYAGRIEGWATANWCAMFVSWCAASAGVSSSVIRPYAGCDAGMSWFKSKNRWRDDGAYIPARGDIIFFGTPSDSTHTGIVEYFSGGRVHTIEGNTSNSVARRDYARFDNKIIGYGVPLYVRNSGSNTGVTE